MTHTKTGPLPTSQFIFVNTEFTHEQPIGYALAHWVQVVSIPGRAWGLNVLFADGGMLYRNVPPWAIAFDPEPEYISPEQTQMWNCYSDDFTLLECPHLLGMRCEVHVAENAVLKGEYLFQSTHINDPYSAAPDQDKTMIWVRTDCGRLTIYPNNRVLFRDPCFISDLPAQRLKLQDTIYSVDESISTL